MLPLPIISNTSILPVNEIQLLKQEIADNMWPEITSKTSRPNTVPFSTSNTAHFKGLLMHFDPNELTMWGSPWGTRFTHDSYFVCILQHSFPNESILQYYKNNPTTPAVFVRSAITYYPSYNSVTRNGYKSSSYGSYQGTTNTLFIYYDYILDRVMQYDPSTMSEPIPRYSNV